VEEFDAAWGEVEKGLRDSFRAGRERKRGQRLENTASNAQRQMEMIRQRQSQAPKAAAPSRRTAPRRTVSSPPTPTPTPTRPAPPSGGPKRATVSAPPEPKTERQMWGRPEGAEAIDVEASMEGLTPNPRPAGSGEMGNQGFNFFSPGRQEQAPDLGPVPTPAVVPERTPERDLGDRKGKVYRGYNDAKQSYQAAIDRGDITPEEATRQFGEYSDFRSKVGAFEETPSLEESKAKLSGGEQAIPVPQNTGSTTSQQPIQQIPADPIDTATENVEQAIDLSDGVDDPTNNEAMQAGWDAVEQEIAPPPAPPAPAPIATPASQEPTISNTVNDGYNQALNQQFSEANRDVRNLTDEFGAEPGEPEPPTSVADTPVKVEDTEQRTSVADTPVEAPKAPSKEDEAKALFSTVQNEKAKRSGEEPTEEETRLDPNSKAGKAQAMFQEVQAKKRKKMQNPTEGLPKAKSSAKETAAEITTGEKVSQAAKKDIASGGVPYTEYSKHIQGAMQGNEASLDFLRNNPDAVKQFNPKGLPKRIQDSIGGEAPAKKAPAKKTTAKTVASGKQPKNPKKKSERSLLNQYFEERAVNTEPKYGTFRGKKPGIKKSLSLSDFGFLRPVAEDIDFLTDREGRPSIAQALNPSHMSMAFARPEKLSLDDLLAIKDPPLSFGSDKLMNNKGMPIMLKPPAPTGSDRFLHFNTGLSGMKANAAKHPLNSWNVDGKTYKDDGDFKAFLAATGLKSRNRNPFGTLKLPKPQFGRPILYHDPTRTSALPKGGLKLGYEMNMTGVPGVNRGLHQIHVHEPLMANKTKRRPMANQLLETTFGDIGENFGVKNVEMSIKELASRIKSATAKDSPGGDIVNVNDTGMDKGMLRELMQSLLTQPDQDETATISAGNTDKAGGYSVPLGVQLRGSDALDGDSERNLLTYLQAPYGIKEYNDKTSALPNLPPNMLE
jgi:hypothetical protein